MAFALGKSSLLHREGIDERLIAVDDLAIKITLVDFGHGPFAGLRTAEQQNELFRQGKSKADGYTVRGKHQDGRALDFYAFVGGRASWERDHLAMVAAAQLQAASMLGIKISWGGLWIPKKPVVVNSIPYGWDCPHIQLEED